MVVKYQEISWSTVASRALLFSLLWWILTDGNVKSWWIGIPAVSSSVIGSIALLPPVVLVWRELLKFAPFFFWHSLQGGADVAWRAFHPSIPIAPTVIDYPLRLPPGLPQVMMANIVSLLPGTLSTALDGKILKIHLLDGRKDFMTDLKTLEHRVARICGALVAAPHGGE